MNWKITEIFKKRGNKSKDSSETVDSAQIDAASLEFQAQRFEHNLKEGCNRESKMIQVTEEVILNVLNIHAPIKAIRICSMISKDYGKINKREVNALLYAMQKKGTAHINEKYEWCSGPLPKRLKMNNAERPSSSSTKSGPLAAMAYSEEQDKAINIEISGNLLIRGQAGSGKTTVLAARAGKAMSVISKGSILFLTYNAALCRYVDRTFKSAGANNGLKVTTFHEWAKSVADHLGYDNVSWATQKDRTEQIKRIIDETLQSGVTHRLYDSKDQDILSWWNDEFAWIFGQGIVDFTVYNTIERVGRGLAVRLPAGDREYVWYVFDAYRKWLDENGKEDYDNLKFPIFLTQDAGEVLRPLKFYTIKTDSWQNVGPA